MDSSFEHNRIRFIAIAFASLPTAKENDEARASRQCVMLLKPDPGMAELRSALYI